MAAKFISKPTSKTFSLGKPKEKPSANVIINWRKAISVADLHKGELNPKEEKIAQTEEVIYIFVGYKKNVQRGVDTGQTSRALDVRAKEHIAKGDYLEGYPLDQVVYVGDVQSDKEVDRDLLEQMEGAIIQHLADQNGAYNLCNDNKVGDYKKPYNIIEIENNNLNGDLKDLLPLHMYPPQE